TPDGVHPVAQYAPEHIDHGGASTGTCHNGQLIYLDGRYRTQHSSRASYIDTQLVRWDIETGQRRTVRLSRPSGGPAGATHSSNLLHLHVHRGAAYWTDTKKRLFRASLRD